MRSLYYKDMIQTITFGDYSYLFEERIFVGYCKKKTIRNGLYGFFKG